MFGHDNQNDQKQADQTTVTPTVSPPSEDLLTTGSSPAPVDKPINDVTTGAPDFDVSNVSLDNSDNDKPSDSSAADTSTPDEPADDDDKPAATDAADDTLSLDSGNDELVAIKQDALQQLSPLVDHLDQSPEEKFRTTMMMIQASDDQKLVKTAFDAAKEIADDKTRAQALLDVINEINYFTQQNKD